MKPMINNRSERPIIYLYVPIQTLRLLCLSFFQYILKFYRIKKFYKIINRHQIFDAKSKIIARFVNEGEDHAFIMVQDRFEALKDNEYKIHWI